MATDKLYWRAFCYFACGLEALLMLSILPIVAGLLFLVNGPVEMHLLIGFGFFITTLAALGSTWIIVATENDADQGLRSAILQKRIEWGWKLLLYWNPVGWTVSILISLTCLVWMVWQTWLHGIDNIFDG